MTRLAQSIGSAAAALGIASLAGAALVAQSGGQAPAPRPADVAGRWSMTIVMDVGTGTPALELKQESDKLSGTYTGNYGSYAVEGRSRAGRSSSGSR